MHLRSLTRRTVLAAGLALGAGALAGCGDPPTLPPLPLAGADRGNVTYRTADDIQVVATFTPPSTAPPWPTVVLMHQYQGTRAQWNDLTPDLLAAGLAVLAPDARAHGESLRRVRADGGFDFETDRANSAGRLAGRRGGGRSVVDSPRRHRPGPHRRRWRERGSQHGVDCIRHAAVGPTGGGRQAEGSSRAAS